MSRKAIFISRILVAGLFVFAGSVGAAEPALGKAEVSGFGGLFHGMEAGGFSKATFGGSVAARVGEKAQLFGEFDYVPVDSLTDSGSVLGFAYTATGSYRMYNGIGGIRYHFVTSSRFMPYIVAAGGLGHEVASGTAVVSGIKSTVTESTNAGIFGFGGGLTCFAGSKWGVRPEVRYQRHQYKDGGANALVLTVGVFYQIGR
jgi:hypothetical protein